MKQISFGLDTADIDRAISELKEYGDSIKQKANELCQNLAEDGKQMAEIYYSYADKTDGNGDVSVAVEPVENGYKVLASGEHVAFREFGAGATAQAGTFGDLTTYGGAWSQDHAKQYWEHGRWYFKGTRYTEIQPTMAMQHASEEIRRNISRTAREVFTK